jgi:hypothetical protein
VTFKESCQMPKEVSIKNAFEKTTCKGFRNSYVIKLEKKGMKIPKKGIIAILKSLTLIIAIIDLSAWP